MPHVSREEFKRGFIKQCQVEGLTTEGQILDLVSQLIGAVTEKRADVASIVNSIISHVNNGPAPTGKDGKGDASGSPWPVMLGLSTAVPGAVGATAGALASKLKGNWLDEEDVQQQELIDELRRQTQLARQYRRIGGTTPSSF